MVDEFCARLSGISGADKATPAALFTKVILALDDRGDLRVGVGEDGRAAVKQRTAPAAGSRARVVARGGRPGGGVPTALAAACAAGASLSARALDRVAALLEPGDTCWIGQGTYRETVKPARSGEPGRPITFRSVPGERATIKLPDERNGLLMVFRPFERLSYALVLEITDIVQVGDRVGNPR